MYEGTVQPALALNAEKARCRVAFSLLPLFSGQNYSVLIAALALSQAIIENPASAIHLRLQLIINQILASAMARASLKRDPRGGSTHKLMTRRCTRSR
ncbi:hypothetical protein B0H12DRAFT_1156157 [Mycena haematopus]|nr:hypothetical protein B0H12DRAFT_1156157 [Mycena haematopus]